MLKSATDVGILRLTGEELRIRLRIVSAQPPVPGGWGLGAGWAGYCIEHRDVIGFVGTTPCGCPA